MTHFETQARNGTAPRYSVVIPTVGRPSLSKTLEALGRSTGPAPEEVLVVDDRADRADQTAPLDVSNTGLPVRLLRGGAKGPAAARNVGWRAASSEWVAFLDDDVVPSATWRQNLVEDLAACTEDIAANQGRVDVPLPEERWPTDWERNTKGLETACWATADMAYRRCVLEEVGGFDERFHRAFREDADLGLRVLRAGYFILRGERRVLHPVRPADSRASLRAQAGNADDVLMLALHGPGWRQRSGAEKGRTGRHLMTSGAALAAFAFASRKRRFMAFVASTIWLALTGELGWKRIAPGPRNFSEVTTMVATTSVLPLVAAYYWLVGWFRLPRQLSDDSEAPLAMPGRALALSPPRVWVPRTRRPRSRVVDPTWKAKAVLFDRDGTLVRDVPYNGSPDRVFLMPGARTAARRARQAGLGIGVVSNQSGVAKKRISHSQLAEVNKRVEDLLGPVDTWAVCTHDDAANCSCRKPAPGLVHQAAQELGVPPSSCALIGDIGSDIDAALAAGARSVLVPTAATDPSDVERAPAVAANVLDALDQVLAGTC